MTAGSGYNETITVTLSYFLRNGTVVSCGIAQPSRTASACCRTRWFETGFDEISVVVLVNLSTTFMEKEN